MSEQTTPTQQVMPGAAGVDQTNPIPPASSIALEDILPVNPRLFSENRWEEYFARLRDEDPIHFNETTSAGRFGPSLGTKTSSGSTPTGPIFLPPMALPSGFQWEQSCLKAH